MDLALVVHHQTEHEQVADLYEYTPNIHKPRLIVVRSTHDRTPSAQPRCLPCSRSAYLKHKAWTHLTSLSDMTEWHEGWTEGRVEVWALLGRFRFNQPSTFNRRCHFAPYCG